MSGRADAHPPADGHPPAGGHAPASAGVRRPTPRVTTVLESLAAQRASGVLEIDGDPAGVVYLDRGQISYAEASWVPDLAARFCASREPPADVRALLLGGGPARPDQAGGDLRSVLLSCITREELAVLLRSVIVDAILALTVPLSGDAAVSGIRFEAPRPHWASAFAALPVDSVREEAVCRAARMARYGVTRTTVVTLRDLSQSALVLTREQWAVASRIGRTSTVRDLAWRSGRALCDTIECVGRLVRAGVCTLGPPSEAGASAPAGVPAGASAGAPAGAAEPGHQAVMLPAPGGPEPLPRRRPGTHLAMELSQAADEIQSMAGPPRPVPLVPASYTPPPADVLHRLLDGLRNLK